jgi:hypothetical protein
LIKAQRDLVAAQEELLNIQRQLLEKREVEITAVQSTAQQEIKSFSSVLKEECATALAPKKIQSAIVAASEDRGCNIIIHGLEESTNGDVELETQVESLLVELGETQNVKSVERLGRQCLTVRPVKVVLNTNTNTNTKYKFIIRFSTARIYGAAQVLPLEGIRFVALRLL